MPFYRKYANASCDGVNSSRRKATIISCWRWALWVFAKIQKPISDRLDDLWEEESSRKISRDHSTPINGKVREEFINLCRTVSYIRETFYR